MMNVENPGPPRCRAYRARCPVPWCSTLRAWGPRQELYTGLERPRAPVLTQYPGSTLAPRRAVRRSREPRPNQRVGPWVPVIPLKVGPSNAADDSDAATRRRPVYRVGLRLRGLRRRRPHRRLLPPLGMFVVHVAGCTPAVCTGTVP
jgi:hypothetical protein